MASFNSFHGDGDKQIRSSGLFEVMNQYDFTFKFSMLVSLSSVFDPSFFQLDFLAGVRWIFVHSSWWLPTFWTVSCCLCFPWFNFIFYTARSLKRSHGLNSRRPWAFWQIPWLLRGCEDVPLHWNIVIRFLDWVKHSFHLQ